MTCVGAVASLRANARTRAVIEIHGIFLRKSRVLTGLSPRALKCPLPAATESQNGHSFSSWEKESGRSRSRHQLSVWLSLGQRLRTLKGEPHWHVQKRFEIDHSFMSTNFATPLQRNRNLHNGAHAKSIAVSWSEKFPALNEYDLLGLSEFLYLYNDLPPIPVPI
jgi:hypothetical protein